MVLVACCAVLGLCLVGCGGGGGSTGVSTVSTATGKFVDAPVEGLTYQSGNTTGKTKADGSFTYEVGKTVTFSIGGKIVLGEADGQSIITPVDLSAQPSATAESPEVIKIVRLLMTLNSSGANNKMVLSAGVQTNAANQNARNVQSLSDADLLAVAKALDATKNSLATPAEAKSHLSDNLANVITGAWIQGDPTSNSVLAIVFLDGTHYVGIENNPSDSDGHAGMEMGPYSWNPVTMKISSSGAKTADTNGDWGFDNGSVFGAEISGDTLTLQGPDDPKFHRLVANPAKPLVGAWIAGAGDPNDSVLIVFTADGKFLMAEHHTAKDPNCQDGIELGTYSWNATTGAITVNIKKDTSGDWGFSDAGAVKITVSGNTMTFSSKDGTDTATRVGI